MLKTLRIENFRCFPAFELQKLGQLNLLVGENNSGKTSILEAIQLLTSQFALESLGELMIGRSEYISTNKPNVDIELDISHLFYGHEIDVDSTFSIFGDNNHSRKGISISIRAIEKSNPSEDLRKFVLELISVEDKKSIPLHIELSSKGGLALDKVGHFGKILTNSTAITQFVACSSLTTEKMVELFDQIVLTPEEALVIEALQTIEPNIQRIATTGSGYYNYAGSRSGFIILLKNGYRRTPIGSMGDGIWRILGLALAIVNAKGGVLLVDEIDTGLHFGAMSKMWKLIWETAKRLNVQVFATTHNSDCWKSLAEIASVENPSKEGITIQRIERDKPSSVVFTERQIVIASEREIEVR